MDKFKAEAVNLLLDKLFNEQSYFSICSVDKMGDVIGCNIDCYEHIETLRALHCIKYKKMSPELRESLPLMVMECLSIPKVEALFGCNQILANKSNPKLKLLRGNNG